uniref:Uncharacterized protein n=1 Tax=Prymnesium polylepis TaxID=72548 RepID=A0A7S4IMF4_9EUKA
MGNQASKACCTTQRKPPPFTQPGPQNAIPISTELEKQYQLPLPPRDATPAMLVGKWRPVREIGSVDAFYAASMYSSEASIKFAVATSRRFMKHNILEFYTDEEGEVSFPSGWFDFGGLDFRHKGQAKQLAVRQLASGEYLRPAGSTMMGVEDEALPIGTFECMNSFTKAKQQLTIGWNQGRLEITIADETLAADSKGVLYRRIQTDGITMCEIGCIGAEKTFCYARLFQRLHKT